MQDLDDIGNLGEDGKSSQGSSSLLGAVLHGPEPVAVPAVPAGPTGAGELYAASVLLPTPAS